MSSSSNPDPSSLFDSIWLAVQKSKKSRGKKKFKHHRYQQKNKTSIIRDRITGEFTLRHRLPMNWRMYARDDGYGPKVPYFERAAIFLDQAEQAAKQQMLFGGDEAKEEAEEEGETIKAAESGGDDVEKK